MKIYEKFMERALELALNGTGYVSPNPRVGAVIVEDEKIIGEGWHKAFGNKHAEIEAIENSQRSNFENCTLFVTLEPCTHFGKTPPCTDTIIEKKFSKVVIGMIDPNPVVAGSGVQKLKDAGIEVISGVLESECKWMNRFFSKYIQSKIPYVILKVAQSLDGNIALKSGVSQWITCHESRKYSHYLRSEVDAVLVGKNTTLLDNPSLTVRDVKGRNPMKVVLDSYLTLPLDLKLFKSEERNKTIICCSTNASTSRKAEILKLAGIKILPIELYQNNKVTLEQILIDLAEQFKISSIVVEGGAEIFSSFLERNLVDEIQLFIAPMIIGSGIQSFKNLQVNKLDLAPKFDVKKIENSGTDIHIVLTKS